MMDNRDIDKWFNDHGIKDVAYTIRNGRVNISKHLDMSNLKIESFPFPFGTVKEAFIINDNLLTNFKNFPTNVGGDFEANNNKFTSLEGMPQCKSGIDLSMNEIGSFEGIQETIYSHLLIDHNLLASLKGAPKSIAKSFMISNNQISSFDGAPETIGLSLYIGHNKFTSLKGIHNHIKKLGGKIAMAHNPISGSIIDALRIEGFKGFYLTNLDPKLEEACKIINKHVGKGRSGVLDAIEELVEHDLEQYCE